jgi:heme exporter protein A
MPPGTLALDSEGIEKRFGYAPAVRDISLQIPRGEFVALFGRNGAGKTTFLRIAATLVRPSKGRLAIEGYDVEKDPEAARRCIGFLSHNTFVYRDLSALENLRFFSRLYKVSGAREKIPALLDRVGLGRRAEEPVRALSRGLQQRVGIARVMLHDPSLLLLDEPYTGLDAQAIETLDGILDESVRAGKTVVLTTHDLDQGLRSATRAVIIDKGRVIQSADARDPAVREAYDRHIRKGEGA